MEGSSTSLGQLVYTLTLNNEGFAEELGQSDEQMTNFARTAELASGATETLGTSSQELAANISTITGAADGAVGEITVLGTAADGSADAFVGTSVAADKAAASMATLEGVSATTSASIAVVDSSSAEAGASMAATTAATSDLGGSLGTAAISAETAESGFVGVGKVIKSSLLPLAAMFGLYESGKTLIEGTKEATDAFQKSNAALQGTITNNNDAIGLTVKQLDDLAESTAKGTTITGNANLAVEQTLIGYSAVNKDVLPTTIQLVDDLATRMAKGGTPSTQQLTTASKELGTALEDPTKGATAFTRAMVTFTPAQQDAIKKMEAAGDTAGAQKLIMQDLASVVGGSATAATHTFAGSMIELKNEMEPIELDVGQKFYTLMGNIGHAFADAIPYIEKFVEEVVKYVTPGIEGIRQSLQYLIGSLETLSAKLEPGLTDVLKVVADILVGTLAVVWQILSAAIQVVIDLLAGLAQAITYSISFLERHKAALVGVVGALSAIASMILVRVVPALIQMGIGMLESAAKSAIAAATIAADWIAAALPFLAIIAVVAVLAVAGYEIIKRWTTVKQWFDDFINGIKTGFSDAINWIKNNWEDLSVIFLGPIGVVLAIWHNFHDQILDIFHDVVNTITGAVSGFGHLLEDAGKDLIKGLVNGIKSGVDDVVNAVKDVGSKAVSAAKSVLKIFSPSQVFADIGQNVTLGLAQGITSNTDQAVKATQGVTNAIIDTGQNVPMITGAGTTNNNNSSPVVYNFSSGAVQLTTADAVDEFFNIGNRNAQLEMNGISPLAGTTGV